MAKRIMIATEYKVNFEEFERLNDKINEFLRLLHTLDVYECDGGDMGMEIEISDFNEAIAFIEDANLPFVDSEYLGEITKYCEPFGGIERARKLLKDVLDKSTKDDGYIHIAYC